MTSPRILIGDHDPAIVQSMSWVLRENGYDVQVAKDATAFLEAIATTVPDLILLDTTLPGADGYQTLERLKSDPRLRDVPVLTMSALPPEETAVRMLGLGAADFVRKPFRVKEVLARIQAQLRMRAILRSAHESLRATQRELTLARQEAASRKQVVDILNDVTADLGADEIYHLLARRVARALDLTHCSVILARDGESPRVAATAFEQASARGYQLDLERYPEIREALATGRPVLVENVMTDPLYASERERWRREGLLVSTRSVIALPFALDATQAGVFFLRRGIKEPHLRKEDAEFAETVVRAAVGAIQRARTVETTIADNRRLEVLAHTDPLTGLLNRRALVERIDMELERVRRYDTQIALLLIDLDHFKSINDTHGHLVGDEVLRGFATVLQRAVRSVDIMARFGGEEFVIVLPETGEPGAVAFADRLREVVAATPFVAEQGIVIRLTTSIGVALYPASGVETADDLLAKADHALYRAKSEGRNRVAV